MNLRTLSAGVLTAGLTLTGLAAVAAPAQAASYDVTIKVKDSTPELKDRVTIKGSVSPAAPGKPVVLQVRYDGQKQWKTVGRTRLNQAGKYQFREKVKTVREREYRVVKPALGRYSRTVSDRETVTVFHWRDLSSIAPVAVDGFMQAPYTLMNGVTYPESYAQLPGGTGARTADFNLNRDCTELRATAGLSDASPQNGTATVAISTDGTSRFSQTFGLTQTAPVSLDLTDVFRLSLSSTGVNGGLGALGTPQVYCSF